MPRYRPIVSQADAALALAEDFARAARDMGDMPNYYRWRDVAKQWRLVADAPFWLAAGFDPTDVVPPSFQLT